ncbi:MAG TPA: hypothetical protein VHS31_06425, partial [Tepidisphaeraceae bacterium]|nr:hypothetical protein [Tepidisphaeraceae bacterium]
MTTHRIYPAWKELLVYEESPDRKLQFQCDCVEPYQVHLPAPELWPTQTPPWAHDRRDLILNRLRAANCIICEVDRTTISILSPDNTFRVEIYSEPDDRGHPLRALRIRTTNNQLLADIHDAHLTAEVTFPAPGELILPFNLNSTRYKIAINIPNKTFSFLPNGGTSVPLSSHSVLSPQHSV